MSVHAALPSDGYTSLNNRLFVIGYIFARENIIDEGRRNTIKLLFQ